MHRTARASLVGFASVTAVTLGLACMPRNAIPSRFSPEAHAPSFPAVAAANVTGYWGLDWEKLPEGVTLTGPKEEPTVALDDGYPTANDPNVILGMLDLGAEELPPVKAKQKAVFADEVGRRGGNAYVEMPHEGSFVRLIVLHISDAPPALAYPPASTLIAEPAPELASYAADGAPVVRHLDAFAPLVIDGKRGSCYGVRAALDGGAALNRLARRDLSLRTRFHGDLVDAKGAPATPRAPISLRSVVTVAGCPVADGPISVGFEVGYSSKHPDADKTLGTGDVEFQVFARSIDTAELDHRAASEAVAARQADDQNRTEFQKHQCGSCIGQLALCPSGTDPASCQPFSDCVFQKGMRVSDCF